MTHSVLVRELTPGEKPKIANAKTGDTLPDGTVLLWRQDMDRMGLDALRSWLEHKVIDESVVVAVVDAPEVHHGMDEEYSE